MLNELRKHDHLGTPESFYYFVCQLVKSHEIKEKDLSAIFANKVISGRMNFNGCILYAKSIGLIIIDIESNNVTLNPLFEKCLVSEEYLKNKILEQSFSSFSQNNEFHQIFNSKYISYDVVYNKIQITNSAFKFKYANFKQLLLDFGFIIPHPDKRIKSYIVEGKYKKIFDTHILPTIKNKKIGLDELKQQIEKNNIYGEEAEEFVLSFEKERLKGHSNHDKIEKISDYYSNAGYDVISFDSLESEGLNRHIEVKSFSGKETFFWSRNEMDVARIKRDEYYLYLVDRSQMKNKDYVPTIIQNPHDTVLSDDKWNKRVEKYFISC